MKYIINGVIVVEGKSDVAFLESFIDAEFVVTNGSEISKDTISYLKNISLKKDIYVLTDPDSPGKRIRDILDAYINNLKHCFVDKSKCIKHGKVGVAESNKEEVINALKHFITTNKNNTGNISMADLYNLGLVGQENSNVLKNKVCKVFNLGYANSKTMLKRLNYLNISIEEIKKVITNKNSN